MKSLVLYYSYSGKTKALAAKKAAELGADIEEVTEVKRCSIFKAFTAGAFRAIKRRKTEIVPIKSELKNYDQIIIMAPVWASNPAPAFNSIIELIPPGKKVELVMVSGGGGTKGSAEGTKALVTARNCELTGYTDVKS